MATHKQVAKLLKRANDMAGDFAALPWGDLSEDEFNIVLPLGIGLLKAMDAAADIVLRGQHNG
jgi:hypothetical protein